MPIHNRPSADGQAILLLCSSVGLGNDAGVKALTPTEYNDVATALRGCGHTPAELLGLGSADIGTRLGTKPEESERMARLLGRDVQFAIEMEQFESLGIWAISRVEAAYPQRWKDRLQSSAPPVVFGVGDLSRLGDGGLAVVGSRDVDDAGAAFARDVGRAWARDGRPLVSGGARGVDRLAMAAALDEGGAVVGVLADSLVQAIRVRENRDPVLAGRLTLVLAAHPAARFSAGLAMGRNKLVYALADRALVVSSGLEKGGTWAGAPVPGVM